MLKSDVRHHHFIDGNQLVSLHNIMFIQHMLDPELAKRAEHYFTENMRVKEGKYFSIFSSILRKKYCFFLLF